MQGEEFILLYNHQIIKYQITVAMLLYVATW